MENSKLVLRARLDIFASHNMMFMYEINAIKKYIRESEQRVAEDQKRFTEYLNKNLKEVSEENHGSVYSELEVPYWQHIRFLPNFMFNSIFISIDSFVEVNLITVCNLSCNFFPNQNKPIVNNKTKLKNYVEYLEQEFEIKIQGFKYFQKIFFYKELRNIFNHRGGWFVDEKLSPALLDQIEKMDGIEVNVHQEYLNITSSKFLFDYIELLNKFFKEVTEKVNATASARFKSFNVKGK